MKNSKLAAMIATALLMVGMVPASSAQGNNIPEGIEVITIVAKRQTDTVAAACVNEVIANTSAAGSDVHMDRIDMRRAIRQCVEQKISNGEARI